MDDAPAVPDLVVLRPQSVAWIVMELVVSPQTRAVGRLWLAWHLVHAAWEVLWRAKLCIRSHREVTHRGQDGTR